MTRKANGQERAFALLGVTEIRPDQVRSACILLAGLALGAADGDWDAAGEFLRQPLEAIGVIPYESAERPFGRPRRMKERQGDPE